MLSSSGIAAHIIREIVNMSHPARPCISRIQILNALFLPQRHSREQWLRDVFAITVHKIIPLQKSSFGRRKCAGAFSYGGNNKV
ncbi:MAG: hypothetical protein LBE21_10535 [Pseudomonadales bacterium]|jgi:hypothetical protein|nr:hypothetical protein [Pseudomonadales bacterium]